MTGRQQHGPPTPQDVAALLAQVEARYDAGVSPQRGGPAPDNPALWQGEVLAQLDDAVNADPQRWSEAARACGLGTADGVRALLRLSCASAVAAALRYALGAVEPATGEPATPEAVLDEIAVCQWWLDGDSYDRTRCPLPPAALRPRRFRLVQ